MTQSAKRLKELNTRLANILNDKGVTASVNETTTELIEKVADIKQSGGGGGIDLISYAQTLNFDARLSEVTEPITLHLENMVQASGIFDLVVLNTPKITVYLSETATSLFRFLRKGGSTADGLKELEVIGSTKNVTSFNQFVIGRTGLERIIGEIDFSSSTNNGNMFDYCYALQQFTPKANTIKVSTSFSGSPDLTDETIQAIINGLADLTGSDAQTLTFHADVKARLTNEQIATITGKNWTLA